MFSKPIIIAGPCSAESRKQIFAIGEAIKDEISLYRAGIWKPRTRPGGFEGIGEQGLKWLADLAQHIGKPVTVEVANSSQLQLAMKYEIKDIWIGSRTTSSPFAIQDIADGLVGHEDIHVLIKNPINPDLNLWIGAIERIQKVGVKNIAVIHRGFSTQNETIYRNSPMWEIPIKFKQKFPNIDLICDPSHISGCTNLIAKVSQKAYDLDFNGLMIEVHDNPLEALSDANQQLTPGQFKKMLSKLVVKSETWKKNDLDLMREDIDMIDDVIMSQLKNRMEIVEKMGKYKQKNDITIYQPHRLNKMLKNRMKQGLEKGLSKTFVSNIFQIIHDEALKIQEKL